MSYCSWDQSSELNIKYHDSEWGVPLHDDRGQFEFLMNGDMRYPSHIKRSLEQSAKDVE